MDATNTPGTAGGPWALFSMVLAACAPSVTTTPAPPDAGIPCVPGLGELRAEAGFVTLPDPDAPSSARLFYAFHPANPSAEQRPLVVLFNGGPGVTTTFLLSLHTGPVTLDPELNGSARVGANPHSWTRFANLLYVDARGAGFSYDIWPGGDGDDEEYPKMDRRTDATQFLLVILDFLQRHPALRCNPVVLSGESYGGTRAVHMFNLLFNHRTVEDVHLADALRAHFTHSLPGIPDDEISAAAVARQFGYQALIQPYIQGWQDQIVGWPEREPGTDPMNQQHQEGWSTEVESRVVGASTHLDTLHALLGVDPRTIPLLLPDTRFDAVRQPPSNSPWDQGSLPDELGPLRAQDYYYTPRNVLFSPAPRYGEHPTDAELFVPQLKYVHTFITNAHHDRVVWTPGIIQGLRGSPELSHVTERADGRVELTFAEAGVGTRVIRFPAYAESGHMVSASQPGALADDVEGWLAEVLPEGP